MKERKEFVLNECAEQRGTGRNELGKKKRIKRVNLRTRNSTERKELMNSLYPLYRAFFAPSFCSFVSVSVCLSHFISVSISFTHALTYIHTCIPARAHPQTHASTRARSLTTHYVNQSEATSWMEMLNASFVTNVQHKTEQLQH